MMRADVDVYFDMKGPSVREPLHELTCMVLPSILKEGVGRW